MIASFYTAVARRIRDRGPEQPPPDVVRDGLQPLVGDRLAVDARHVVAGVAHDVIDRRLILALVRNGPERVPQRVEVPPPSDAERIEYLAQFGTERVRRVALRPA